MHVDTHNSQKELSISLEGVQPLVQAVLAAEKCRCDEVAIHFVSEKEICKLHKKFFDDPTPTDCISFPMKIGVGYRLLGDVFVCPKVAVTYAEKHEKDPYRELTLYVVHGLLHLIGYDDIEDEDRAAMRAAEQRLMRRLYRSDLILFAPGV